MHREHYKSIVFTSEKLRAQDLVVTGRVLCQGNSMKHLAAGCNRQLVKVMLGHLGGNNDADNSGTMKYVQVNFLGAPFSPGNRKNCLSLEVGSGTTILDIIVVPWGYDDGFELWGELRLI